MKKITTKINFLKLGVLLFGVSLFLWNCKKEEFLNEKVVLPQYRSPIESMETVSLNDINSTIKNTIINFDTNFARKSKKYISYSFNDIIKIVDTLQNTKFSIRFKLNNQPDNVIYNLITGTRNDNSTIAPYVIKYTINNLSEITNNDGYMDFLKFKGTVGKYRYADILKSLGKKYKSRNASNPELICSEQTFSGRRGGYGGIDNDRDIDRNNYGRNRRTSTHSGGANSHFPTYTFNSNSGGSKITGFTVGDGTLTTDDGKEVKCNDLPVCPTSVRSIGSSSGGEVVRAPSPNDPQPIEVKDIDCDEDGEVPINPPGCVGKGCITPCAGDPVNNPEIAPQKKGYGITGGMFGWTRNGGNKFHNGLDLINPKGAPIYAMYDGTARLFTQAGEAGHYVDITSAINGKTVNILYFHMQQSGRVSGMVNTGDIIGYQGESGNLKGAIEGGYTDSHLHIKVKENGTPVDPIPYLKTEIDPNTGQVTSPCN